MGKTDLEDRYASVVKAIEELRSVMSKELEEKRSYMSALEEKRSNPESPETCAICGNEQTTQNRLYHCRQCKMLFCESHLVTVGTRYNGNVMYLPYQTCPQGHTNVQKASIKVDITAAVMEALEKQRANELKALQEQSANLLKALEEQRSKKWWQF